jgi:large subunit ribosomal protein L34
VSGSIVIAAQNKLTNQSTPNKAPGSFTGLLLKPRHTGVLQGAIMAKRIPTYQPSKVKRNRTFGFRKRNSTKAGKNILKARRAKGRKRLAASSYKK